MLVAHYKKIKELGEGAFGKVYLAYDTKRSRQVALKVPVGKISPQKLAKIRNDFSQEVALTARLSLCPHVVAVLDHDINRSIPYMTLEYCDGGTLKGRMTEPYTMAHALRWGYEISLALQAAHKLQPDSLIHRDLKPDNILLAGEIVKVSDFGGSKMLAQTQPDLSTRGGYTPRYAAPESFEHRAYPTTDIWSLGVILYQLLSGRLPFPASSYLEILKQVQSDDPVPLQQVSQFPIAPAIAELVHHCLQKRPEQRPSADVCVAILHKFHPVESQNTNVVQIPSLPTKRQATTQKPKTSTIQRQRRLRNRHQAASRSKKSLMLAIVIATVVVVSLLLLAYPSSTTVPKTAPRPPSVQNELPQSQTQPEKSQFRRTAISHPQIANYKRTVAGDVNGDGKLEFIILAEDRRTLFCLSREGKELWQLSFSSIMGFGKLDRWDGEYVLSMSYERGGTLVIVAAATGKIIFEKPMKFLDGAAEVEKFVDLDGDSRQEVVVRLKAGASQKPRGVVVYHRGGRKMWHYPTGPGPDRVSIFPQDKGAPNLVFGSHASSNGNQENSNRTHDNESYGFSLSADGRSNWIIPLGGVFHESRVFPAQLHGEQAPSLYAFCERHYKDNTGTLYKLEATTGKILQQRNFRSGLRPGYALNQSDPQPYLYLSNKFGKIYQIDANLNIVHSKDLNAHDKDIGLQFADARDYTGDGQTELFFYQYQVAKYQDGAAKQFAEIRCRMLDQDLQREIFSFTVPFQFYDSGHWRFEAISIAQPGTNRYCFAIVMDKIWLYE